jgi:hypothetical protein
MSMTERILGYLWLGVLGVILFYAALIADRRTQRIEEYPFGCDSFGYLQMAQEIRVAAATPAWPVFHLESPHIRSLVDLMRTKNLGVENWEEVVGPHAHHYFPRSNTVGVQYPPGTGLLLAMFPQGKALHLLDRSVIGIFLAVGLFTLVLAARKKAWSSAALAVFALALGFEILGSIRNSSFSINAVLAPLLLFILCLCWALNRKSEGQKSSRFFWLITFLSGSFFGLAVLVRLPVLLFLPGIIVLLWPARWLDWKNNGLFSFGLGTLITGALPLAVFQSRLVGAWYLPTYGRSDAAPPTLDRLRENIVFYLGGGDGSTYNWALISITICSLLLIFWSGHAKANDTASTSFNPQRRLLMGALLIWTTSTAYFLTHSIAIHFYAIPCAFTVVTLLAFGTFSLESKRTNTTPLTLKSLRSLILILVMIVPAFLAGLSVWRNYWPAEPEVKPRDFVLPAELADERAWIWSDSLSGTLWYYNRKPAHKIQFTGRETRALIFDYVFHRGEPQYVIHDDEGMQSLEDEIAQLGGKLEKRGLVDGYPYYLIQWPPDGPKKSPASAMIEDKPTGAGE